jgi:hypothetical protein
MLNENEIGAHHLSSISLYILGRIVRAHIPRPLITLKLDGYSKDEVIFYLLYIFLNRKLKIKKMIKNLLKEVAVIH